MIGAVILAAGTGRRLGGVAKALLRLPDGATFLEAVARTASAGGVGRQVVVVGEPHRAAVEVEARRLGLETVVNPSPERGMASSVAVGFAHAAAAWGGAVAALLWPVDHPRVAADTVRLLVARVHPGQIVIPAQDGRGGHPALCGRDFFAALCRAADSEEGARGVFRANAVHVRRVEVGDPGVRADVDTPGDLP